MRTVSRVQRFGNGKCELSAISVLVGRNLGANVWQGKVQTSSPILALLRWRHFRLSLSLSLSLSVSLSLSPSAPHAQYRKRGIYCAWGALGERERESERNTETDGSDVTIVALKLAMSLHFPLPKVRTNGDEFTLSLAKNSHFSFLPSHFPSLPS